MRRSSASPPPRKRTPDGKRFVASLTVEASTSAASKIVPFQPGEPIILCTTRIVSHMMKLSYKYVPSSVE